ncbi:MAG: hypothetical protein ACRDY7_01640 [Acidimicrobiia bacterium]
MNAGGVFVPFVVFALITAAAGTPSPLEAFSSHAPAAPAPSFSPSISDDGTEVAFASRSDALTAGDTNHADDVFVRQQVDEDHFSDPTRASVAADGAQGDDSSFSPSISADGRYVAFESEATTLAPGDGNGALDVFLHDRHTGSTILVSRTEGGSSGNAASFNPSISGDGGWIAFGSEADDLTPGDANATEDVFVHERATGRTLLVSVASDSTPANGRSLSPSISDDGRVVAFASFATNLAAGDVNEAADVFVYDRRDKTTERVNAADADGRSFSPVVSGDGSAVAFVSFATNLVDGDDNEALDAFVFDRDEQETTMVSVSSDGTAADGLTFSPSISGDGRYVAFKSEAPNLVPDDGNGSADVFVHDRDTAETSRVSVDADGVDADGASVSPSLSGDGRFVAFASTASDVTPGDDNEVSDVFVHDRRTGKTIMMSKAG